MKKLFGIFLFHLVCLGLLLIPDRFQGPVMATVLGLELRILDISAVLLIILGSILLTIFVLIHSLPQIKQLRNAPSGGTAKKNN